VNDAAALARSRRWDRAILLSGLAAFAALLWAATTRLASGTHSGHTGIATLIGMWVLMMAAMMAPVAAPSLLAVAARDLRTMERRDRLARATLFLWGDLLVWSVFSLLAALAQWRLGGTSMASSRSVLTGALLVAIGLFQFTPLKEVCLRRCRELPDSATEDVRRHGNAFRLGLEHGAFSAGSCGALMLVLLATGAMSLPAMALLTGVLVLERVVPRGLRVSRTLGVLLSGWGAGILVSTLA
jgi:predicted metal-binding membrane protein